MKPYISKGLTESQVNFFRKGLWEACNRYVNDETGRFYADLMRLDIKDRMFVLTKLASIFASPSLKAIDDDRLEDDLEELAKDYSGLFESLESYEKRTGHKLKPMEKGKEGKGTSAASRKGKAPVKRKAPEKKTVPLKSLAKTKTKS